MYLISKKTPTQLVKHSLWIDLLKAEIQRDVINAESSQNEGAIMERIYPSDEYNVVKIKPIEIELDEPNSDEECFYYIFQISEDLMLRLYLPIENLKYKDGYTYSLGDISWFYNCADWSIENDNSIVFSKATRTSLQMLWDEFNKTNFDIDNFLQDKADNEIEEDDCKCYDDCKC